MRSEVLEMGKSDRIIMGLWVCLGLLAVVGRVSTLELVGNHTDFGAEYGNIAASLVEGRGYAGAFEASEQPTSWMPPLLPFLIAGVFQAAGVETILSAQILVGLQMVCLLGTLVALLLLARQSGLNAWLISTVFGLSAGWGFLSSPTAFHDAPFLDLLICWSLLAVLRFREERLGLALLMSLILPLASPAIVFAFVVLILASRQGVRKTALVLAVCALPVTCWAARNALVLRGFVPIKSNLWFDFHQANLSDSDGVNTSSTFNRYHPIGASPEVLNAYRDLGEIEFNRAHREACLRLVAERPWDYLVRVLHRLSNATLYLRQVNDVRGSHLELPARVQAGLVRDKLAEGGAHRMFWNCLQFSPDEVHLMFKRYPGYDEQLMADWSRARSLVQSEHSDWKHKLWGILHSLLPTLTIAVCWLREAVRRSSDFQLAAALYVLYLLPYVLVSHYERYQLPLLGLAAFMVGLACKRAPEAVP